MAEIAAANPDEEWLQPKIDDEAEPQEWHGLYWRAWAALRHDRSYGAMGGEGPIHYASLSRYARDHGVEGDDFRLFHIFMTAIDAEWLDHVAERESAAAKHSEKRARA